MLIGFKTTLLGDLPMFFDLLMTLQPLIMGENLKEVDLELKKGVYRVFSRIFS